jgi:putative cell wall-binding protein
MGTIRTRRVSLLVGAFALLASLLTAISAAPADAATTRVSGTDRYATAAQLSAGRFAANVPVAYVATGLGWADALAAGAAAAHRGGPVLLVDPNSVPSATRDELTRLKPAQIVVVGGAATVSDSVLTALRAYSSNVIRTSGADRYVTAANVATGAFTAASSAFVAGGEAFADALAAVPAAHASSAPILLVSASGVPTATADALRALGVTRVTILGGTGSVSDETRTQLDAIVDTVTRLSGADRALTSVEISKATFASGAASTAYLANGSVYADALAAGPVAALAPGPILLSAADCVSAAVNAELDRLNAANLVVLGGTGTTGAGVFSRTTCSTAPPPAPAPTGPRTPVVSGQTGPAFNDDAPDPQIVRFGSTWYAYTTGTTWGNHIGVLTSTSPTTGWRTVTGRTFGSTALANPPGWQVRDTQWAPGVYEWAGRYRMFYAAKSTFLGVWCLSSASSDRPSGGFVDTSEYPLLCQPDQGGSIDPQPFVDAQGRAWLHWKNNDGSSSAVSKVWVVPLGLDGATPIGDPIEVMAKDTQRYPWQLTLDNPQMVIDGGTHYLFYSGGNWEDDTYVVGYAVCSGPTGPCTSGQEPILRAYGSAVGTGGGTVAQDAAGNWYLSYHAWDRGCTLNCAGGKRRLYVANLTFR